MRTIRISALGYNDLKNIGRYTGNRWGTEQRNYYLSQLQQGFEKLAKNPQIGRSCDEITPGYKRLRVGEHLIFYRFVEEILYIIRVLHKNVDVENHF